MSDTTTCPNCSADLRAGAAFCTTCGHRMDEAPSAASPAASPTPAPTEDATRVDNPGLDDATQTWGSPPAATWTPPEQSSPPAAPPWQPAEGSSAPSGPPAAPPTSPPPAAPWNQPSGEAAPPWQQAQSPAGGNQWGAPPAPAPSGGGSSSGGSPIGGIVAILGAILTIVGLFTAWVGSNQGDDTISGWDLASGDKGLESKDPYFLLALGIVALIIGVLLFLGTARMIVRIAAVVVGIAIVAITVRDWMSIADLAKDFPKSVEISAQFGFYLTIVGGVITAAAAILPGTKSRTSSM